MEDHLRQCSNLQCVCTGKELERLRAEVARKDEAINLAIASGCCSDGCPDCENYDHVMQNAISKSSDWLDRKLREAKAETVEATIKWLEELAQAHDSTDVEILARESESLRFAARRLAEKAKALRGEKEVTDK